MVITIKAENLFKSFNRPVLKNLNFTFSTGRAVAVTGHNGAGKSTLLEIIAGIKQPGRGKLRYEVNSEETDLRHLRGDIGFSSMRVNPYGELTALENIEFVSGVDPSDNVSDGKAEEFLKRFNLLNDRNKQVKYFSSGMKQRLRLILATLHDPHVLILDEPGANLDSDGREMIYSYIESVKKDKLVIIATNEEAEADICEDRITL
ncbi:MAG: ABC transporter ATP-binding protein [Spirochaetes bacterium]|nr:ABC transporter ATP-binding protein [Spirochaetota bacterium]